MEVQIDGFVPDEKSFFKMVGWSFTSILNLGFIQCHL